MDDENNNQEFKSMSPTTTEANYKAFNEPKKKKSNGAGFGKVVILPFVCGVLGAALTVGLCVNVPSIKQAFLEKIVVTDSSNKNNDSSENNSTNLNTQLISLQGYSDTAVGVAKKVQPSIVAISVEYSVNSIFNRSSTTATAKGSGIIISEDGYILTNNHVVDSSSSSSSYSYYDISEATSIKVKLNSGTYGNDATFDAKIVGKDSKTDLAVLKIEKSGLTPAEFANSDEVVVGEFAMAVGSPLGLDTTVTCGIISAVNREVESDEGTTYTCIQTDAAINSGNSGGALVNAQGKVIGINTLKLSGSGIEGIGFAIPINSTLSITKDLITYNKVLRPYIGITGMTLDEATAKKYNLAVGIYVKAVQDFSPAEKAGLQVGDVILKADGKEITTMKELDDLKNTHNIGDSMTLKINRNGQEKDITVTLAETP